MAAETGHAPNRSYFAQDGSFHLNGAAFFNNAEINIAQELENLDGLAAELALLADLESTAAQIDVATGVGLSGSVASAADSLAIPVTHNHVAKTTGGDAEALTLANGTPGQILTISLVANGGGDGTLTPTTKTGFTSIVFADAGDIATLRFVDATVGWVIMGTAGVAAPPVIVA